MRSDFPTCSSSCPAYWVVPWFRCLWILLIRDYDYVGVTFLSFSRLFIGYQLQSTPDAIDILYIPNTHSPCNVLDHSGFSIRRGGYGNENFMIVFWGSGKSGPYMSIN